MNSLNSITLDVADTPAAKTFYTDAFGLHSELDFRQIDVDSAEAASTGFRGFTLSITTAQPSNVDAFVDAAAAAGATVIKPAAKSFWGYGGSVQAPDGTVWTVASSAKKDSGPASRDIDQIVLLLGVDDVKATKEACLARGFEVERSFGRKYVEFKPGDGVATLALQGRKHVAKNAGVPEEGSGSHRVVLGVDAEPSTDPDSYIWERVAR